MPRIPFFGKKKDKEKSEGLKREDSTGNLSVGSNKSNRSNKSSGSKGNSSRRGLFRRASEKPQKPPVVPSSKPKQPAPVPKSGSANGLSDAPPSERALPQMPEPARPALSSSMLRKESASLLPEPLVNMPAPMEFPPRPVASVPHSTSCPIVVSDEDSQHSSGSSSFKKAALRRSTSLSQTNPKSLTHSASAIGLDEMIEDRREIGTLGQNVVHIEVPFGKPIEEVYDGVHSGPVLGSGISGMVRLVTHKATGLKYAVKVLDLGLVETAEGLQQLREEIFIMCQLDHPNIVRLEEVYESHSEIYLVQELCLGGELFDRLDEQPDYHYTEAECARLVKQMLSAVRYLHTKGIIHRDLKLENFLFSSVNADSELKMIDFGLSKHFSYGEVHHDAVGTPYTVAPEVIRGSYDERCDIWAIGVISFLLLSGDPPFGGCGGPEPLMQVRANILQGSFAFEPVDIWQNVSKAARDFISGLLVTDPSQRPTAEMAQQHDWLQHWARRSHADGGNILNPNVVKALVNFKEFSDMRKLLCEVLSFTLLPEQIKDLRREFEKMDTDGSGEISLSALKQVLMTNANAGVLGALTEEEVTDIFDAMRVRKTETRIHWHEFIAAGLSQCSVDDRNLRLAFDRLDSDHKGYITLDDIMDLMGSDALQSEEDMRRMWGDSIKAVKCQHARITYDDFLLLMKGQTKDGQPGGTIDVMGRIPLARGPSSRNILPAVPETVGPFETPQESDSFSLLEPGTGGVSSSSPLLSQPVPTAVPPALAGEHPFDIGNSISIDEDYPPRTGSLTPPMTPVRGAKDYISPRVGVKPTIVSDIGNGDVMMPPLPGASKITPYTRRTRSRSLGDDNKEKVDDAPAPVENANDKNGEADDELSDDDKGDVVSLDDVADAVRDMILPDHAHMDKKLETLVNDKSKSALVVNRHLYRAHRQMRMAVLEASKRFEEQQARHARDVILAEREKAAPIYQAGLVMRHGHKKQVSSEAIRAMLAKERVEQQKFVDEATRRGGRGRRGRKKTISDMSAMLNVGSEEFGTAAPPLLASSQSAFRSADLPPLEITTSISPIDEPAPPPPARTKSMTPPPPPPPTGTPNGLKTATDGPSRKATVPGNFKKVNDPFSSAGKYGAMAKWQ